MMGELYEFDCRTINNRLVYGFLERACLLMRLKGQGGGEMKILKTNGETIFENESNSLIKCIEIAVQSRADLSRANLNGANLSRANLSRADLPGADLTGVNLNGADLRGANLFSADLRGANLIGANLFRADLRGANLFRADLFRADLRGADLTGANLTKANLTRAKIADDIVINLVPLQVIGTTYSIIIFDVHMKIGCEFHSLDDWWGFDTQRIKKMDGEEAVQFWEVWKEPLKAICDANGRG